MDGNQKVVIRRTIGKVCSPMYRYSWISQTRFIVMMFFTIVLPILFVVGMVWMVEGKNLDKEVHGEAKANIKVTHVKPDTAIIKRYVYKGNETMRYDFPGLTGVFEPIQLLRPDSI